jgi:hypothetical protein
MKTLFIILNDYPLLTKDKLILKVKTLPRNAKSPTTYGCTMSCKYNG